MRMTRILSKAFVSSVLTVILATPVAALAEDKALFNYKGKTWKKSDLPTGSQQAAFELEMEQYEKSKQLFDGVIFDLHVAEVAKTKNKPVEDVEKDLLKIKDPSDSEAKSWFEKNKDRIPYPFEQIKGEIKRLLIAEQSQKRRQELVQKLKKDGKFSMAAKEPVAPSITINTLSYPVKGNAASRVTIVEFADYQCPHCREAAETMKKILPKYQDKVKFVFMDFPINPSGVSRTVAEGAFCANEQKKFWEYHDAAFSRQSTLNKDSPVAIAKELKLDEKAFEACMKSGRASAAVAASKAEAERIGVSGTPAIYVNGRRQYVAHKEDDMVKMIESAISQK